MKQILIYIISLLFLQGCNLPGNSVEITSGAITTNALFSMKNEDIAGKTVDLGEHIITDDPLTLTVRIFNNTQKPYTDLNLLLDAEGDDTTSITFMATDEGAVDFPGKGGTCKRILDAGQACEVKLVFAPREERQYLEKLTLTFRNYIEAETYTARLKLLAGRPASLVFTNDITQYTFGDLIGTAMLPVVERDEGLSYTKELEIVNAGGLPAKNLSVVQDPTCISTLTNTCPANMGGAFTIENKCPKVLPPTEKCKVVVNYTPKNKDPVNGTVAAESKEITYKNTVMFSYVKDPTNGTGVLNGYFRSVSTNIEARFKVAIASLNYETPVVAGNRDVRTFRINNLGYREGEIKAIAFRDSGGSLIATCSAKLGSDFLDCFNAQNNLLSLEQFPFTVKDRNGCLTVAPETVNYIIVGNGCIIDLYFQPSVNFITDMNTEFTNLQPEVVFDSRWKGLVNMVSTKLFNLSATSKAAARIVLDKVRYDSTDFTPVGSAPWIVQMGRQALQSPNFFKRKSMLITFKNLGSISATNISLKDGTNKTIPIGGTGVNLGAKSPYFFTSAIASDSTCTVIGPGESCSVNIQFAPIGLDTTAEEDANMFDGVGFDLEKYKSIALTYDSGALYLDNNRTGDPNYPLVTAEARIKAQLIRKGLLMQLADDTRNVTNFGSNVNAGGTTSISHLYVQNIGTGPIPYFRLQNPPISGPPSNLPTVTLLPTPDPAALGADYDCLAIGDEDFTYVAPANATPATRAGLFSSLPKDESCVYTVQFKSVNSQRFFNARTCGTTMPTDNLEEGMRLFSRDLEAAGGTSLWEFCPARIATIAWTGISLSYYDGDSTDPSLPPGSTFGRRLNLNTYNFQTNQKAAGKLLPHSFVPWLTATLYRPGFTYPSISGTQPARVINDTWFYGNAQTFFNIVNDPTQSSPFLQGDDSRNFVQTLPGYSTRAGYDYIYYIGSFPQGSPVINFPMSIRNFGELPVRLKTYTVTPDPNFTALSIPTTFPSTIAANGDVLPLNFRFNPSVDGEHRMIIEYSYESGLHTEPLIYKSSVVASNLGTATKQIINQKILVLAHVQASGTHGSVTMTVEDYDVIQNPGTTPTESLLAPYSANLTWNTNAATTNLVFDTIKLTAAATPNDVYAKKRITYTNNTAFPITDLKTIYRLNQDASTVKAVPASFTTVAGSTCTAGMTLAAGASCTIILRYQPLTADTSDNFHMSLVYRIGVGQYVMQNASISLLPRSPGQLIATGKTAEVINYKQTAGSSTVTRSSYPLNFGTATLNVVPKPFVFDTASGTFQKLQFTNTQSTKASLLLSYQKYVSAFSLRGYSPASPAPTSLVPQAGDYRTFGGLSYAVIYKAQYSDNTDRIVIEASKGCFFGDDENNNSIAAHQKGFNNTTTTPCYLLVTFNANFEYLKKTIAVTNGDDMRGTAAELWYFSVNRSSTSSIWIHLKGTINPDVSVASGSNANIQAFENKTVSFSTQKMTANNSALGSIVGLRVLMSTTSTGLNDPYAAISTYVDIKPYNAAATQYADFVTGLLNGQYYYFRVVAIRKDTRFVDVAPKRFIGLGANEYLSAATNNATALKVLVPPVNHYYFHDQKLLVEKTLTGGVTYDPYLTASNRCVNKTKLTIKDPANVVLTYRLITLAAWNLLLATPAATSYTSMSQVSHWTSEPTVSITTKCSGLPGYLAGQNSQMLNGSSVFYIRNGASPNNNVNWAVGGVPGTSNSNYMSYVDGAVGYGSSRCMVVVP